MIVVWLFLAVPWVCLQFVIVVFPGHTHLLLFDVQYHCNCILHCTEVIRGQKVKNAPTKFSINETIQGSVETLQIMSIQNDW